MRILALLALLGTSALLHAELPGPRLDRLFPMGAAAGSTVEVEITAGEADGTSRLFFEHPGIRAEHIKDRKYKVSVAADVPSGTYDARIVARLGLSSPRLFAVSRGMTEIVKVGVIDAIDKAQQITMNSIINGNTDGNREDYYRFPARKGQRITIDCQAAKMESPLDAVMTLYRVDGKSLATSSDYFGRDPFIDFLAPEDGDYVVSIYDLSYRGGNPYRLLLSDRANVENVFPRAVQSGKSVELTLLGRNLGAGATPSKWTLNDLPMQELRQTITVPNNLLARREFTFFDHPTDYSVAATAATCRVTGFQYQTVIDGATGRAVTLVVVDEPVRIEVEPNDSGDKAQPIQLPAVVSGRFDRERDADWYSFECPETGKYVIHVLSEQIGGRADPYVAITDDKGARLAEFDDFGHRLQAFDGHLRDPFGVIDMQAKKTYRILVQDRYRRGGARFQYVLTIRKEVPEFYISSIHSANPGPLGTNLRKGGAAYLDLIVHSEALTTPIIISGEKLPPGVHVAPTTFVQNSHGAVVIWADENAPDYDGPIELLATSKIDDKGLSLVRTVRATTRIQGEGSSRPTRQQYIGVHDIAPFRLSFDQAKLMVEAGKSVTVKVQVKRLVPDFTGKVKLIPLVNPGNMSFKEVEIGDGQNEVSLTIETNGNAKSGTHTFTVLGQAQVPFQKDEKGTKANQLMSQPAIPLQIEVLEPMKK